MKASKFILKSRAFVGALAAFVAAGGAAAIGVKQSEAEVAVALLQQIPAIVGAIASAVSMFGTLRRRERVHVSPTHDI